MFMLILIKKKIKLTTPTASSANKTVPKNNGNLATETIASRSDGLGRFWNT